jgi:hypothetical protein
MRNSYAMISTSWRAIVFGGIARESPFALSGSSVVVQNTTQRRQRPYNLLEPPENRGVKICVNSTPPRPLSWDERLRNEIRASRERRAGSRERPKSPDSEPKKSSVFFARCALFSYPESSDEGYADSLGVNPGNLTGNLDMFLAVWVGNFQSNLLSE